MLTKGIIYFIGCPLFGLHVEIAPRGEEPFWCNPSTRFLATERGTHGDRAVWIGRRMNFIFEPRSLRKGSPLLIIE